MTIPERPVSLTATVFGRVAAWSAAILVGACIAAGARAETILAPPGDRDGYGRVAFACPQGTAMRISDADGRVKVTVAPVVVSGPLGPPPRNVTSLRAGAGRLEALAAPGARARLLRAGGRCLLDVLDPAASPLRRPPPPPAAPAPDPADLAALLDAPAIRLSARTPPATASASGPLVAPGPIAAHGEGTAFVAPFGPEVGAAAFRRGATGYLVFAQRKPIDLSAVPEAFARRGAAVVLLSDATLIRMRLSAGESLGLSRARDGWDVSLLQGPSAPAHGIVPSADAGRLMLPAEGASDVVTVPDEQAGTLLLVGVQRQPGEGIAAPRRTPEFMLPVTWQGVVVEPLADTLALHATASGFMLTAPGGLAVSDAPGADARAQAAAMTRILDLPSDDAPALMRLLASQIREAARAPALARGPARLRAARTMAALGLGQEAQGLVKVACEADPRIAASPETQALAAAAALLAGRPEEAAGIDEPALDGTDEAALWRALRRAPGADGSPAAGPAEAAAVFAAAYPLALAYAPPLRDRLLPLIAETMASSGQADAARRLMEQADGSRGLELARAMASEAAGAAEPALAAYDAVAAGRDRRAAALAGWRATELRLASGRLDAAGAADALDRLRLSWRGDARETAARLRSAELRIAAGQWKAALSSLREVAAAFPDDPEPARRLREAFLAAMRDGPASRAAPLDVAAMVSENADLVPAGPAGDAISELAAGRLEALGLDDRAGAALTTLLDAAAPGERRAAIGLRLARLKLRGGDPAGALAALAASAGGDPGPGDPGAGRAVTAARAHAALGETGPALAALAPFATPEALEARASILERSGDWPAAAAALARSVAAFAPAQGPLSEAAAELVLRQATASARAGDMDALAGLRRDFLARLPEGRSAGMFRLLTASPVTSTADLPRAAREAAAARALAGR